MNKNVNDNKELMVNEESESGATMVEYALLIALIAVALIAAISFLQENVCQLFSQVGSTLTS